MGHGRYRYLNLALDKVPDAIPDTKRYQTWYQTQCGPEPVPDMVPDAVLDLNLHQDVVPDLNRFWVWVPVCSVSQDWSGPVCSLKVGTPDLLGTATS